MYTSCPSRSRPMTHCSAQERFPPSGYRTMYVFTTMRAIAGSRRQERLGLAPRAGSDGEATGSAQGASRLDDSAVGGQNVLWYEAPEPLTSSVCCPKGKLWPTSPI